MSVNPTSIVLALVQTVTQMLTAFQESTLKDVKPISKECLEALQATLMLDPAKRATVNDLLALPWCSGDEHDQSDVVAGNKTTPAPRRPRSTSSNDRPKLKTSPVTAPSLKPLKKATSRLTLLNLSEPSCLPSLIAIFFNTV